jgi:hypothetical protein
MSGAFASESGLREHLRRLDDIGRLGKLLDRRPHWLPWGEIAWWLQFGAFGGVAAGWLRGARLASETGSIPAGERAWLHGLLVLALALRFGARWLRSDWERRFDRVLEAGELVPAAVAQANDRHFAPGNTESWPGAVVISFDPRATSRPELLHGIAARVEALRRVDRRTLPSRHAEVAWTVFHEMHPVRSIPIPGDLTDGVRDCVLATVMLPARPLVRDGLLRALALRGDSSPDALAILPEAAAAHPPVGRLRASLWRGFLR